MIKITDLRERSEAIRKMVEELRSEAYITVQVDHEDKQFYFFASFNLETGRMEYNVTDAHFIELKTFAQVPPEVLREYGVFIGNILNFENGGELVYTVTGAKPMSVSELSKVAGSNLNEEHIDDSEAQLR